MYGGPLRAVIDLSSESRPLGMESEIVGFGKFDIPDCPLPREAFHCLPLDQPAAYRYCRSFKPWLTQNLKRFDGVVIHGLWQYPNWAAHLACLEAGVKYACFPHGMLDPWSIKGQGQFKRLKKTVYWYARERKILLAADCLLFTTERERMLSSVGLRAAKEQKILIPFGIASAPAKVNRPARPELALSKDTRTALFLGRIHPKKNLHFLIRAWVTANVPDNWRLLIAGPGEPSYLHLLRQTAASSPRGHTVLFVGAVSGEDKTYLLQNCTWFLLPSQQENFGVAVLEAIGNGCAVAISNHVYLADAFHPDSEVLPLEQHRWIEFFEKRMVNEQWRSHLCKLDAELVQPKFAIKNVARSWAATLGEVFAPTS
jgi:glycosyltransferase involved in cell wall biosynthesis